MNKNFIAGIWTLLFVILGQRILIKGFVSISKYPDPDHSGIWEGISGLLSGILSFGVICLYCVVIIWLRNQFLTRKFGTTSISLSLIAFTILIFLSNYFQIMYRIELGIINLLSMTFLFAFQYKKPEIKKY